MNVNFAILDNALNSLRSALAQPPNNDLERDGVIQRFEYTFELTWKVAKRVLESSGVSPQSPRAVIRDLARVGFIDDADKWMLLLEARNYTSHTYSVATAQWVFSQAPVFLIEALKLVDRLKKELEK